MKVEESESRGEGGLNSSVSQPDLDRCRIARRRLSRSRALLRVSVLAALLVGCSDGEEEAILSASMPAVSAPPSAAPEPQSAPAALFEKLPAGQSAFARATAHLSMQTNEEAGAPWHPARMVEWVEVPEQGDLVGPLRVEYAMDVELTQKIFRLLRLGRVSRGHVIVMEPATGRVLAYASTAPEEFPATRAYPAASLIKVVTAAAALDAAPERARENCVYRGSPYRLTPKRVYRPSNGLEMSLERSLATSNNQCFAQLAVSTVGDDALLDALGRFGWLSEPAPGHAAGTATAGAGDYDLGLLGCGLAGCSITPLHAAQLAGSLVAGELIEPWWIERVVDVRGRELAVPSRSPQRKIMTPELADELREMLVRTTTAGTARSAFRDRRGRSRLGDVRVAGKTGNLTGNAPRGRYEWFMGVAPAEEPTVAIAVLQLQSDLWWMRSSEIGAEVLATIFCEKRECRADLASRYTDEFPSETAYDTVEVGG